MVRSPVQLDVPGQDLLTLWLKLGDHTHTHYGTEVFRKAANRLNVTNEVGKSTRLHKKYRFVMEKCSSHRKISDTSNVIQNKSIMWYIVVKHI